ncbi:MAG: hypothetical protein ACOYKD_06290 [Anaerolineaceae bacterium]
MSDLETRNSNLGLKSPLIVGGSPFSKQVELDNLLEDPVIVQRNDL